MGRAAPAQTPGAAPAQTPGAAPAQAPGAGPAQAPGSAPRVGDARYAMLPTALRPLWGVEAAPDGGVVLYTDREMSGAERRRFVDMLLGRAASR